MPHLVVLGRPSGLAGDDFSLFLFLSMLFKLIQVGLLVPLLYVLSRHYLIPSPENCFNHSEAELKRGWYWLVSYWSLSALLIAVTMILYYFMIRISRRGTPSQPEKRSILSQLCAFNLIFVTLLRVLVLAFGILSQIAVQNLCSCRSTRQQDWANTAVSEDLTSRAATNVTISITWSYACDSGATVPMVTLYRGLFATHAIETSAALFFYVWRFLDVVRPLAQILRRRHLSTQPSSGACNWALCCRMFCTCTSLLTCCLFGGMHAAFHDFVDLSTALEDFFDSGGTLDVTISDIVAGIVMVHKEQLEEREECRRMFRRVGGHNRSEQLKQAMASMKQQAAHYTTEPDISLQDKHEQPSNEAGLEDDLEAKAEPQTPEVVERQIVFESMILRRQQFSAERVFEPKPRFMLDPRVKEDRMAILEGAHFIQLALAIYGHKLYLANHMLTGPPFLWARSLGCCTYSCRKRRSYGDGFCGCYRNAFLDQAGLSSKDLLYATFREGIVRRPYCIVVDKARKCIVVVIRGTLSMEDLVADFTIRPIPLGEGREKYGHDLEDEYVHSGLYASAEWVYDDIEAHGILRKSLLVEEAPYKNFMLYLVGHSLGAGVASVLSLLLRSKYPNHRCLAFEPPGCVFSEGAARKLNATSYVYNHDIVPRLSIRSLENLRSDVLLMLARMKVSKDKVILPTPFNCQDGGATSMTSSKDMLHELDEIPRSKLLEQLEDFNAYGVSRRSERAGLFDVQLYPPGKIVHIFKSRADSHSRLSFRGKSEEQKSLLTAIWADNGDFGEIELAASMMLDHDPTRIFAQMKKLVDIFKEVA